MGNCKTCGCGLARSIQERKGMMRPYPPGFLTCTNPTCRLVYNTNNGDIFKNGKLIKKEGE